MSVLTSKQIAKMKTIQWWHRIELGADEAGNPVVTPGRVAHGPVGGDWPTTRFGLPEDLTGKTVLDIGAWDGFFSFEAEKRGAVQVVAADVSDHAYGTAGFEFARKALGSKVTRKAGDLSKVEVRKLGQFDVVLCYGVLYHMPNPWTAFDNLFALVKPGGLLLLETATTPDHDILGSETPAWTFFPGCDNDPTNYWYPNHTGVIAALKHAGFENAEMLFNLTDTRATYTATKAGGTIDGTRGRSRTLRQPGLRQKQPTPAITTPRTINPPNLAPQVKAKAPTQIQETPPPHAIYLPLGLIGFERLTRFTLVGRPQEAPLLWLKAEDGSGLAFLVVPPSRVVSDYHLDVSDQDVKFLGLTSPREALVLAIVTRCPNGLATVNLKGPIVINGRTSIGKQLIPNNAAEYSTQHPLPAVNRRATPQVHEDCMRI
jgi:tRNA (mo5U34)-methyltransferase